ncbi:MAG: SURF1 family cytochrome oxidase biogenesis protein, partial [Pseudomonadota bacterium]
AWKMEVIAAVTARVDAPPEEISPIVDAFEADEDPEYTPVAARGRYVPSAEFHVFGTIGPRPGYFVFTRFDQDSDDQTGLESGSSSFFVNRGFVPQDKRPQIVKASTEPTIVTGLFRNAEQKPLFARWLTPPHQPAANIWYARDPALFADTARGKPAGMEARVATGWYIDSLADGSSGDVFPQGGNTRIEFTNRHLEYALTWYGLGLTLIGVWLAFSFRRR